MKEKFRRTRNYTYRVNCNLVLAFPPEDESNRATNDISSTYESKDDTTEESLLSTPIMLQQKYKKKQISQNMKIFFPRNPRKTLIMKTSLLQNQRKLKNTISFLQKTLKSLTFHLAVPRISFLNLRRLMMLMKNLKIYLLMMIWSMIEKKICKNKQIFPLEYINV